MHTQPPTLPTSRSAAHFPQILQRRARELEVLGFRNSPIPECLWHSSPAPAVRRRQRPSARCGGGGQLQLLLPGGQLRRRRSRRSACSRRHGRDRGGGLPSRRRPRGHPLAGPDQVALPVQVRLKGLVRPHRRPPSLQEAPPHAGRLLLLRRRCWRRR